MCICACEQSTEQSLLMGFLPYNHLLLYDTDFLNAMHASKYSGGLAPSDTPAHTRRVATPHTRISSFTLPAASVSPVGMVTPSYHPVRPHWLAPHTLMGVCVCLSWPNWPGSKPRGTGPPPPHHACFTLLIIFFNYLHHLFSITIIIYGRKMHKTSETIQQYVWVNDFQDVRVQKTHADWFSVRLHNNRKGSHLLHSSLYQRVLIHYIVCVFVCMHMRARLSCLRFHRVGKLIISPGPATMRFYPVPFLWRDISSSTLGFSIDYLTFSAFNII